MLDLTLRGATAGLLLLLAFKFARPAPLIGRNNLAVLFALGTLAYVVVSSPAAADLQGLPLQALILVATLNSVFFWWFATALFDDEFHWRSWRLIPALLMLAFFALRLLGGEPGGDNARIYLQQGLVIAMMLHAIWLAIHHRRDDLVERRRRFRVVFAGLIGLTGLVIALVELTLVSRAPAEWLNLLQSISLFGLVIAFAVWLVGPIDVIPPSTTIATKAPPDDPQRTLAQRRLEAALDEGIYKEEGLTIAALAAQLGYPEYRLRQLINQSLGYRNFNAFLNQYRVAEARAMLAEEAHAHRQITQIAHDLGYASIAPFNRAFKASEGVTPSAYRKRALKAAVQAAE